MLPVSVARGILSMRLKKKGFAFLARLPAVHFAVCGLAIVSAGFVQMNWDAMASGRAVTATVGATAWLLATAWLHGELGRRGERGLWLSSNEARFNLLTDSLLAGSAGAIIRLGHESPLDADGIWSVCPVVLVIGALSAGAVALGRADSATSIPFSKRVDGLAWGRVVLAGALIAILGWLSIGLNRTEQILNRS